MKKLTYVGDGTLFFPTFGANADWYGDEGTEFSQRIETGLWAYDENDGYNKAQKKDGKKAAKATAKEANEKSDSEKEAVVVVEEKPVDEAGK